MSDEKIPPQDPQQRIEELEQIVSSLQKERDEYLDGWKRAKADYTNFKNDQEKRSKELAQFASLSILLQYVPILDHFKTAFAHTPTEPGALEWVKGIEQIVRQFTEVMKGMGLEEFSASIGEVFDPTCHQGVGHEQRDDVPDDSVSQQIGVGYRFNGRVVIPAKVIVNKK